MRGTVRLRIHWMKIGGKGLCSDAACLVATQYIALVREGTRERTGNWTAPLQHLPLPRCYGQSRQLIEMRFSSASLT